MTSADLAPAATKTGTFTMQFNNKATRPEACKGAAVTIHYVVN